MDVNLIENPGFEQVNSKWETTCTTQDNNYEYATTNVHNGSRCMQLSSTKNAGWSAISQNTGLKAGKSYHLKFFAKRTTTDVWVALYYNGAYHHYPSLVNSVGTSYSLIDQTISANGSGIVPVTVYIITGSLAGTAWIDDVSLMESINEDAVSPSSDLVVNGGFEDGANAWELDSALVMGFGPYEGNNNVSFINNPNTGSSHAVRQWLDLEPGATYYLFYYVKRSGNMSVQPSIQYTKADGTAGFLYNSSVSNSIFYVYSQQVYQFTLPATAQSGHVRLAMNVYGTIGVNGYVMMDNVQVHGPKPSFQDGSFVKVTGLPANAPTVNVREEASSSSSVLGELRNDTLAICKGKVKVGDTTWVKILWGGQDSDYGYIVSDYLQDLHERPTSLMDAAIRIGQSMATAEGDPGRYTIATDIDIHANAWCVLYVTFLMKAAGVNVGNYPYYDRNNPNLVGTVSDARIYFTNKYRIYPVPNTEPANEPKKGDWIFYNNGTDMDVHVGLVTACNNTTHTLSTVEGNWDNSIHTFENKDYHGQIHSRTVQGFATPTWA